jgi:phosphoadenosine phosphosulfate reductase
LGADRRVNPLQNLDLEDLNQRFDTAPLSEVLGWCLATIPQGLVQSTSFGVNGLVITDWIYARLQPDPPVPVLFLDTLHHFPETLAIARQIQERYRLDLRVYHAQHATNRRQFEHRYGYALWERDLDRYQWLTKVEPLQRSLEELGAIAWITGRRRDQSPHRAKLPMFEWDAQQRLKINPLIHWSAGQVWSYVLERGIPYNPLYDQGYASIGDVPLTTPVQTGEPERAGRWRGTNRTECGIHL